MQPEIDALVDVPYWAALLTRGAVVYWTDETGRAVCADPTGVGYRIVTVPDAGTRPGQEVEGVLVFALAVWRAPSGGGQCDSLVPVLNFFADIAEVLAQIEALDLRQAISMVRFPNLFPGRQPFMYWFAPRSIHARHRAGIAAASALLASTVSQRLFEDMVTFRLTCDHGRLTTPDWNTQCMSLGVLWWNNPIRLIDCGAHGGDTARALARDGYFFQGITAFEANDAEAFGALTRCMRAFCPATCFPCGVMDSTRVLPVVTGMGMPHREFSEGKARVQCVALADAILEFRPMPLIEVDIEGGGTDGLEGAQELRRGSRPARAVSFYDQPEHMWEIPLGAVGRHQTCRPQVPSHGFGTLDTVLYALPSGRAAESRGRRTRRRATEIGCMAH